MRKSSFFFPSFIFLSRKYASLAFRGFWSQYPHWWKKRYGPISHGFDLQYRSLSHSWNWVICIGVVGLAPKKFISLSIIFTIWGTSSKPVFLSHALVGIIYSSSPFFRPFSSTRTPSCGYMVCILKRVKWAHHSPTRSCWKNNFSIKFNMSNTIFFSNISSHFYIFSISPTLWICNPFSLTPSLLLPHSSDPRSSMTSSDSPISSDQANRFANLSKLTLPHKIVNRHS